MTDELDHGIVKEALDQCMEDFKRGLNSHGSPTPSLPEGIVKGLRAELLPYFHRNLAEEKRKWHGSSGDGIKVSRMAFYLGAITAFRADADTPPEPPKPPDTPLEPPKPPEVTPGHLTAALEYVKEHCKGPGPGIRWIYCDWP